MLNVDIKSLVGYLNLSCRTALEAAAGLCVNRNHYEIAPEHLVAKFLEQPLSDFYLTMQALDIPVGRLQKVLDKDFEAAPSGHQGKPVFSQQLIELLQDAWLISSVDLQESKVRSGAVLLAFLSRPNLYGTGNYVELLTPISRDKLKADFWKITKSSSENNAPKDGSSKAAGAGEAAGQATTALAKYCNDLTAQARAGKIDPVFGRDVEIRQIIDVLARRRKNNPIAVGEPGVGKTAVVEGLALRIAQGDVPDVLADVRLLSLDMGLLQAGAGMKGEFENRLKEVINEVKASAKPIVLFIDEAHTLIGAGNQAGGGDAANLLKPALARGELRTIAATTWSEYKKYFEKDAALARRFQPVKLDEPNVETATLILRGLKEKYEDSHGVTIKDDAVTAAAELSARFITGRYLPDKAVDLLDTSAARVKVRLRCKPAVLEDLERTAQAITRRLEALRRDQADGAAIDENALQEQEQTLAQTQEKAAALLVRWQAEKEAASAVLDLRKKLRDFNRAQRSPQQAPAQQAQSAQNAPSAQEQPLADGSGATAPTEVTAQSDPEAMKQQLSDALAKLDETRKGEIFVPLEVTPEVVAAVISDWTGIPAGKICRDQARAVLNLADDLKKRVRGQDAAIDAIAEGLKAARAGLKSPQQPMGVFLLVGPSGVGKTETALSVAEQLFGGEKNTVTINMSEFMEKHTVSRLIGSPPGYVGYGEGGMLTEAVRQKPYSAVLLDETEKAHPEVLNLFYQVFDKGILNDGEGREVSFANTVIFLTSNLGLETITRLTAEGKRPPVSEVIDAIHPELSKWFKPALLARMVILPYYSLSTDALKDIVLLKLDKLATRLRQNQGLQLVVSGKAVETICARCTEVDTGARNIDHILNGTVLPVMSQEILSRMNEGDLPGKILLDFSEEGEPLVGFADAADDAEQTPQVNASDAQTVADSTSGESGD